MFIIQCVAGIEYYLLYQIGIMPLIVDDKKTSEVVVIPSDSLSVDHLDSLSQK